MAAALLHVLLLLPPPAIPPELQNPNSTVPLTRPTRIRTWGIPPVFRHIGLGANVDPHINGLLLNGLSL